MGELEQTSWYFYTIALMDQTRVVWKMLKLEIGGKEIMNIASYFIVKITISIITKHGFKHSAFVLHVCNNKEIRNVWKKLLNISHITSDKIM